jgi:hypothetical protein
MFLSASLLASLAAFQPLMNFIIDAVDGGQQVGIGRLCTAVGDVIYKFGHRFSLDMSSLIFCSITSRLSLSGLR